MSKYRDHRPSRRDRFDGENEPANVEPTYFQRKAPVEFASPPAVDARDKSPSVDAEVVWFDAKKGFGFVKLSDGSEAFLHASKLEAAGQTNVADGSKLRVVVETGSKRKPQVTRVLSIETPSAGAVDRQSRQSQANQPREEERLGSVKRYDPDRGFGFIKLDNGGGDVFVHATTLSRSGLPALESGQSVYVSYVQGQKGLEARSVRKA